ncbi:hypothetical protein [Paenibacillus xylanexedens]|uniref:hypothetical protein n=1 Tax=Paenibacillus xylanexedens TaxID=528191 RepID=UPI0011A28E1D|nr:hypothetical protein [Paenibacillus xylanexedens]
MSGVFVLAVLVAFLTEAVTEVLKQVIPIKDRMTYVVALVVGVGLAFVFQVDLFSLSGVGHYVSIALFGVLASRGANYINGFLKQIGAITGRS